MSKYNTKQKTQILEYLVENKEKHITANDIINYFKSKNLNIGKATVYRQLDNLLNKNIIRKYIIEEGTASCYQYVQEGHCKEHYHLKCGKCGELFHLECTVISEIGKHLYNDHKFVLDPSKTVLYGKCELCM